MGASGKKGVYSNYIEYLRIAEPLDFHYKARPAVSGYALLFVVVPGLGATISAGEAFIFVDWPVAFATGSGEDCGTRALLRRGSLGSCRELIFHVCSIHPERPDA